MPNLPRSSASSDVIKRSPENPRETGESAKSGVIVRQLGDAITPPTHVRPNPGYTASLKDYCLFKNSFIERFAANLIYPFSSFLAFRKPPVASQVVDSLTLWEKYLAHRSRANRRMTFSVSFKGASIPAKTYLVNALCGFYRLLLNEFQAWHHQPLNVVVSEEPRSRILDPRRFLQRNEFRVGIVDAQRQLRIVSLDLHFSAESPEKLRSYVAEQVAKAAPAQESVSVVFDEEPRHFDEISGTYAEFPGAWLRMAPDRETGGLLSTVDHLVLDGSLHQLILLRTAAAAAVRDANSAGPRQKPAPKEEHVISFEIPHTGSMSELILKIGDSLEEQGIRIRKGHETTLLTTIPQGGPEFVSEVPRNRARILPVLLQLRKTNTPAEVRAHIGTLNSHGWLNPLAYAIDRIYCGTTCPMMIHYFERLSMLFPFQSAARFLVGSALLSFIPPLQHLDLMTESGELLEIEQLASTTLRSPHGMPAILIQQLTGDEKTPARMFVSFSGSRHWDCPRRLLSLANSLRTRVGLASFQ